MRFLIVVWLSVTLGMAIMVSFVLDVPRGLPLQRNSKTTMGKIVGIDRGQHMAAIAEYSVGGTRYRNSFPAVGEPLGSPELVYYDPRDPTNASLQEPSQAVKDSMKVAVASGLFFGTGSVVGLLSLRRRKQIQSPARTLRTQLVLASVGVLVGFTARLVSRTVHGLVIVESALVISGIALSLVSAFRSSAAAPWRQILSSRMLMGGGLLAIAGLMLQMLE